MVHKNILYFQRDVALTQAQNPSPVKTQHYPDNLNWDLEPFQPSLDNYEKKHLHQLLTLIKIHKLNLLQLLRFLSWFCLELWGGDHGADTCASCAAVSGSKDQAFLLAMRCAGTFFSDLKLHEGYHTKQRGLTCHPLIFFQSRGSQETAA